MGVYCLEEFCGEHNMIRLIFSISREIFIIEIIGREVFYKDRKLLHKVRLVPADEKMPELFKLTEEEQKEYAEAGTEEELAEICLKDVRKSGGILVKYEK